MTTVEAVLEVMDDVLGLDKAEMSEMLDANLFEEGLLDSLSVITLLQSLEDVVGHPIEIEKMAPEDLATVYRLAQAVDKQV